MRSGAVDWWAVAHLARERHIVWLKVGGVSVKGYMRAGGKVGRPPRYYVMGPDGRTPVKLAGHAEPTLWRPLEHELVAWAAKLPPPAVLQGDRGALPALPPSLMRARFSASPQGAPLLPSAIPYSPPGAITMQECEARILRALKTDNALPNNEAAKLKVRANWPATGFGPGDYPPEISIRWRPFAEDLADYLTAMEWASKLQPAELRLVRRRALGASFTRIGDEEGGRGHEWARQQYIFAITAAWRHANRGQITEAAKRPEIPRGGRTPWVGGDRRARD